MAFFILLILSSPWVPLHALKALNDHFLSWERSIQDTLRKVITKLHGSYVKEKNVFQVDKKRYLTYQDILFRIKEGYALNLRKEIRC